MYLMILIWWYNLGVLLISIGSIRLNITLEID